MATNCYGRRLSDLLQEQQEPFLLRRGGATGAAQCRSVAEACVRRLCDRGSVNKRRGPSTGGGSSASGRRVLCGGKAVSRVLPLRWNLLAGCFSCGAGRERFRRLPRGGDIGDRDVVAELDDGDHYCGRQLSPLSVLELYSDEESTVLSHWEEEADDKPSTSGSRSSPPSDHSSPTFTAFYTRGGGKTRAMEVEVQHSKKFQRKSDESLVETEEQAVVFAWERIAADISRIPSLVELDLCGSAREWRRRVGEEEARQVGESVEAMIFEEVRWEAVRDMICFRDS